MKELYSFINGEYSKNNKSNNYLEIENPATTNITAHAYLATVQDIESSIEAAKEGFVKWQNISPQKRGDILNKIAEILYSRNEELALLEVADTGKPIKESIQDDAISGADCFKYYAGLTDKIHGQQQPINNSFFYTRKEPLGVCLGIGAWNYPLQIACWKAAPCLAAGNSMIFKPSMLTPTTALILAEIMLDAGVPKGVFNVILGDNDIGAKLVANKNIQKISLTGSVNTGKKVMAASGQNLKPCTLELGGKSPLIIFDDCNLEQAIETAALANFYTQGEVCSNGTRVFVQSNIYNKFIDGVCEYARNIKIGDPLNYDTEMGSLISKDHLDKVLNYIDIGQQEQARLVYGGNKVIIQNNSGYFIEPTIFADCNNSMTIAKEEIFGPVMSIFKFNSDTEALEQANNSEFGLAAGIFTNNLTRAHNLASKLQTGTIWINSYNIYPINMPFGGYKDSGIGRENGLAALDSYLQTKSVYIDLN